MAEADDLRVRIGAAIRSARKRAGLPNQEALGDLIGAAQTTASRWERGSPEGVLTLDDVVAIEDVLDLPRGQLFMAGGYVPKVESPSDAIKLDTGISDEAREYLLDLYERARKRKAAEAKEPDTSANKPNNSSSRSSRRATS
jgi:transcriptional regulator with XRE-family HTH domain